MKVQNLQNRIETNPIEQRYIIVQMIEGMTEEQLEKAIILLRQWQLEESP